MADSEVLTNLCSICHVEAPKYTCPRCKVRTCSLPCSKKHKTRADCDGVRNPREFMPLHELRTPRGLDHDYNFLSSIERDCMRAEQDIVEVRQLLDKTELHPRNPADEDKLFRKVWIEDELRFELVDKQQQQNDTQNNIAARQVRRRLRNLDIEIVYMPKGMSRQRENKTSWNKRTNTINFQVEWMIYDSSSQQKPQKILYKALETTPLYSALTSTVSWHKGQLDRVVREADPEYDEKNPLRRPKVDPIPPFSIQDLETAAWSSAPYCFQHSLASTWFSINSSPAVETTPEEEYHTYSFYLKKGTKEAPNSRTLIPLTPDSNLIDALKGRTVVEFPTIVAIQPGIALPPLHEIGEWTPRPPPPPPAPKVANDKKRRFEKGPKERGGRGGGRGGKRVKFEKGQDTKDFAAAEGEDSSDEEGQIDEDGEDVEMEDQQPLPGLKLDKDENGVLKVDLGTGMVNMDDVASAMAMDQARWEEKNEREKKTVKLPGGGVLVDYGSESD
ncbi:hypothetical protein QBC40DRAFT_272271 [Triangularia verruculosa]|uniref:Box C/D snoRNA protein 1 n=1 Tax=Triangularia verruculosa TaxID=2587418 RepID=A0AAN6XQG2_9PEZI|nr:hypothetical protein QBC40DRAFT_272271 [Triangularia verruculosa]